MKGKSIVGSEVIVPEHFTGVASVPEVVVTVVEPAPQEEEAVANSSVMTVDVQPVFNEGVLRGLLPVINQIHDGCDVCRNHFLERANAVLEADGVPWRYSRQYDARGREVKGVDGKMANLVLVAQ
jgi:hypothetical protein